MSEIKVEDVKILAKNQLVNLERSKKFLKLSELNFTYQNSTNLELKEAISKVFKLGADSKYSKMLRDIFSISTRRERFSDLHPARHPKDQAIEEILIFKEHYDEQKLDFPQPLCSQ